MNRFAISLFIILVLALAAIPMLAQVDSEVATQEATQEAPVVDVAPVVTEAPEPDAVVVPDASELNTAFAGQFAVFVTVVVTALWNLVYIPVASPFVELMTSITKRIPALKTTSSPTIAFFFTVLAWFAFVVMTQLGYGDRFSDVITGVVTIASAIFGIPITQSLARGIHAFANKNSIPLFGYSRPVREFIPVNSSQGEKVLLLESAPVSRD